MPRTASSRADAPRTYSVEGGNPCRADLSHDRKDIHGEAVGTRLTGKLEKAHEWRKSAAIAA